MSIKSQGHSLILVKGHSDFKVKCLTFGLYTQVSDSGPQGPLVYGGVLIYMHVSMVSRTKEAEKRNERQFTVTFSVLTCIKLK